MSSRREEIVKHYLKPAFTETDVHWGYQGRHKHSSTVFDVERYIWRPEDLPEYWIAIPENVESPSSNTGEPTHTLVTKRIKYVPTGRILYDNMGPEKQALLFQYRLAESRDLMNR